MKTVRLTTWKTNYASAKVREVVPLHSCSWSGRSEGTQLKATIRLLFYTGRYERGGSEFKETEKTDITLTREDLERWIKTFQEWLKEDDERIAAGLK